MITTKQINVDLAKEKLKLRGVTTRNIDAGVRVEPPKAKIKPRGVSTTTLPGVADIIEKKRRDDIMAEKKKLAMKDEKKVVMVKNEKGPKLVGPSKELMAELTKKSWNKMNAKERKEYQIEKARKEKDEGKDKED